MQKTIKFKIFWFIQNHFQRIYLQKQRQNNILIDNFLAQDILKSICNRSDTAWLYFSDNIMIFFDYNRKIKFVFKIKEGFFDDTTQTFKSEYFIENGFRCIEEILFAHSHLPLPYQYKCYIHLIETELNVTLFIKDIKITKNGFTLIRNLTEREFLKYSSMVRNHPVFEKKSKDSCD